ncbi:MAG TPA: metal ABC transporter permease [Planctomycetota bacterium]|nr:metal ABC transporter permease [Planctomycetota bacterium]
MTFIETVLSTPLYQKALVAGGLTGICCACLSPLVVLKRMAFVGDGIAHASYGGMGLALFMLSGSGYYSLEVQFVTIAYALAIGAVLGYVTRRPDGAEKLGEDSFIGIAFSVSMALGALLIKLRYNRSPQVIPSIDNFLFGSLLNIGAADVIMISAALLAVLLLLVLMNKELLFYAFDARLAEISGVRSGLIHYVFIMLLVLTVTVSSRVVGIVLVSSSLIVPGAVALKVCKRLAPAMAFAALIGFLSFELGAYASFALNVPPGSAIVLIQFVFLLLVPLFK